MRALRPLLFGITLAVMLEIFALPPVVTTGGRAYAAENSPNQPPLPAANNAGSASQDAAAPSPEGQDAAAPSPDDMPLAAKPGSLPLASPVKSSAQCPVAPLPPHGLKGPAAAVVSLDGSCTLEPGRLFFGKLFGRQTASLGLGENADGKK